MTIWTPLEVFVALVCSSPLLHAQATLHPPLGDLENRMPAFGIAFGGVL